MALKAEEALAIAIAKIKSGGGGGGGTNNYNSLDNKPQINDVELVSNKSLSDLGIASASEVAGLSDSVGQLSSNLGLANSRITNLQELTTQLSNDKADKSGLGTASAKNSTSVVTDSSDLVESGAVKDIIGWGNKNLAGIFKPWNVNSSGVISEDNSYKTAVIKGEENDVFTASNEEVGAIVVAFYSSMPVVGSTSYDSSREVYSNTASATFTFPINGYAIVRFNSSATKVQIEKGSTATSYEPYHASVEESKCDNTVIAPVENGTTASQAYAVGSHAIRNGKFITWKNAKAQGETINDASDYTNGDVAVLFNRSTGTATTTNSKITIDSTRNDIIRFGKLVQFRIRITLSSNISTNEGLVVLPWRSINLMYVIIVDINDNNAIELNSAYIGKETKDIIVKLLEAGTYDISGIYLTDQ